MNECKKVWWVCICHELNATEMYRKRPICKACGGKFEWQTIRVLAQFTIQPDEFANIYARALRNGDEETVDRITGYAMRNKELAWMIVETDETFADYALKQD